MIPLDIVRHIAALKRRASHIGLLPLSHMLRGDSPYGGEPRLTGAGRHTNVLWHYENAGSVQIGRKEKIGMGEAVRFTVSRWISFFSAPILPLLCILVIVVLAILFGFIQMIPIVGDIVVDGLGWPLILLAGRMRPGWATVLLMVCIVLPALQIVLLGAIGRGDREVTLIWPPLLLAVLWFFSRCWQPGRSVSAARVMASSDTSLRRSWKAATSPPSSAALSSSAKIVG